MFYVYVGILIATVLIWGTLLLSKIDKWKIVDDNTQSNRERKNRTCKRKSNKKKKNSKRSKVIPKLIRELLEHINIHIRL